MNGNHQKKRSAQQTGRHASSKKYKITNEFKLRKLTGNPHDFTRTSDEVHQSIDICPVMRAFIDTEQFQRLRFVKQLGCSDLVYSCADHNRFQHSIGVSFLAREMCTRIRNKQRLLGTTDKDVLCVTLAGLLHDIGHGPYSHIYEAFRGDLNSQLRKDPELKAHYERNFPTVPEDWSHEHSSLLMIDAALKSLGLEIDMDSQNLDKPLKQIGDGIDATSLRSFRNDGNLERLKTGDHNILTNRDFIFIKECIFGKPIPSVVQKLGISDFIGRLEPKQEWLYDIVANRHNGLDVDKVDYFARDERRSLAQAGKINVQILYDAFVAKAACPKMGTCKRCSNGNTHYMICYPKKCVPEVMDFFRFRFKMHSTVYQHKTTAAGACMLIDILKKADPYYTIKAGDEKFSISTAVINQDAFLSLTDGIIKSILQTTSDELEPSRSLVKRFLARDLYKVAGELNIKAGDEVLLKKAKEQQEVIAKEICSIEGAYTDPESEKAIFINEDDIVVQHCSWHYGQKENNPLSNVRFVDRDELGKSHEFLNAYEVDEDDYETIIPRSFMKQCIRVYSRDPSKTELVHHKFQAWKQSLVADYDLKYPETLSQETFGHETQFYNPNRAFAVPLSQDSDEGSNLTTPKKAPSGSVGEPSPIPLPSFSHFR